MSNPHGNTSETRKRKWVELSGTGHSHSDLRELFLGEVQGVVDSSDPILIQVGASGQVCPEDGVVGHVHERHHGMPALVVVPHL